MSISKEWTEWHLTPEGWKKGDWQTDFSSEDVPTPSDRVVTKIYEETMSHPTSGIHEEIQETYRSSNTALVNELEAKYPFPNHL